MIAGIVRWLAGLRARIAMLLVGGLLIAACGFYGLMDFLARDWARRELTGQSVIMIERLAKDVTTPLLLGDKGDLEDLVARESRNADVIGAAVLRPDRTEIAARINDPRLWTRLPAGDPASGNGLTPTYARRLGVDVYTLLAPVVRRTRGAGSLSDEMFGAPGATHTGALKTQLIGWVKIAYSTARLEGELATARRLGMLILVLVIGLGLAASLTLLRLVVKPLREASDLAREIADGNLNRRLPVRAGDELGTLAESMNSMAMALADSRERERVEAAALRDAAEAVVAIAQGARTARDPASVFRVVAEQLRRVTHCDGIALAVPGGQSPGLRFDHFDPAPPWGGLFRGAELDAPLAAALAGVDPPPLRLQTADHALPLAATLSSRGYGAALLVPLALEGGPPAALLLVSRDPSGFRPAELRVVAGLASHLGASLHAAQLNVRLENAFAELHRTQEQLVRSERLRVAGEMASGIAHEFNNVLAAILGRVQLLRLRARAGALEPQELEDAFGVVELATRDGAETVRRLRQFGKGDVANVSESIDLDAVLREAAEFTRPRWKNAAAGGGVSVDLTVESTPGAWVWANAAELREVFTNLILNAVDALPRGGEIRLRAAVVGEMVTASVEDDGVGMSPETQQRVFEPFFTTKGVQGTGLGLSMVYGIVQRHGGTLAVRSEPGFGTRIEVTLPRASAPTAFAAPAPGASAPIGQLSVLVVDDEPAVRALLIDILEALGHRAVGCGSGEEALADFHAGSFDLVLTDLGMPGMNGWQVCEALRAVDRDVTIAFVTGWGEEVDLERADRAGADAVVAKPFSIEDVERVTRLAAGRGRDRAA
jgi:signal transduction histidine kinase/HAMP domain-containing protein